MLELFYITNNTEIAAAAEKAGINRIFVDMEYIGKEKRQPNMDTVKNHHTIEDVRNIRGAVNKAELLVRVNPVHSGSESEINGAIAAGADIIMLPMWKSLCEVERFLSIVGGRVKTLLLLETDEAVRCLDEVLAYGGFDEMYIGLNDLSLSRGKKFMFELFADGTVDEITAKLRAKKIKFGIGGVGRVGENNLLSAENILCEHYRLGSSMVIVARAFCDWTKYEPCEFFEIMQSGIRENRKFEESLAACDNLYLEEKHRETVEIIRRIKKKAEA